MNLRFIIILVILLVLIQVFYKCGAIDNFESEQSYIIQESITNTKQNYPNNLIPKIIIQTWKSNQIPVKYSKDIDSIKKINSDFEYLFFTDEDIENFIKKNYPIWYSTYLKLPIKIQKIDFFRYIAVYHFGGFYLDLDMTGLKSLNGVLEYDCVFPVDQYIKNCELERFKGYCDKNTNFLLGQYAFGAKPKHPFVKLLIENINKNIDYYIEQEKKIIPNNENDFNLYVYRSTGPDFVTNVYLNYSDKYNIKILHYPKHQYFGEYAKHNYYGTWK